MANREPKVHVIDGVTYVEVDRKAEVGEKIIVSKVPSDWDTYGEIYTVSDFDYDGDLVFEETDDYFTRHGDYVVLEPLESEEVTVDTTQASPAVIEMFTALSRKIVSLERQLADTQRNLETWAEQTEEVKHIAYALDRDITDLEQRTQVINAITKFYEEARR